MIRYNGSSKISRGSSRGRRGGELMRGDLEITNKKIKMTMGSTQTKKMTS